MKTTIHTYNFDTRITEEKIRYEQLCATLRATPGRGHWMESHGGASHWLNTLKNGSVVTLETEHIFDNQWNTAPIGDSKNGLRVFDWAQDYKPNGNSYTKRGHYLEITPEMAAIRAETSRCGYCDKQAPTADCGVFCPHCIDSAYLKEDDLHLTRMRPCNAGHTYQSPELSETERAELLPKYVAAQTHGTTARGIARLAKARADLLANRDKVICNATREFDGFTWLMDHGINTENCIYYDHTKTFSFGWRTPITGAVRDSLLESLAKFPFDYDVK